MNLIKLTAIPSGIRLNSSNIRSKIYRKPEICENLSIEKMSKISSKFHNLRNKISKLNKEQNNKTESSPLVTIFVNDIK